MKVSSVTLEIDRGSIAVSRNINAVTKNETRNTFRLTLDQVSVYGNDLAGRMAACLKINRFVGRDLSEDEVRMFSDAVDQVTE